MVNDCSLNETRRRRGGGREGKGIQSRKQIEKVLGLWNGIEWKQRKKTAHSIREM